MTDTERIDWKKLAAFLFTILVFAAAIPLFFRFLVPILLPFALGYLTSLAVRRPAKYLSAHLHLPKKICAVLLLLILLTAAGGLSWWLIRILFGELRELTADLTETVGNAFDVLRDALKTVLEKLPFLRERTDGETTGAGADEMLSEMIVGMLSAVSAKLPEIASAFFSAFPAVIFGTVVTVLSAFYFCVDGERIRGGIARVLPERVRKALPRIKERLRSLSRNYLRAYLILFLLTASLLLTGFLILGVDYALLLSLVIALIDLLPVLGVGTVLIPWAVVLLLQRQFYRGFGLLILYFSVTVTHEIAEPRLLGKTLGIHPLLALASGYAGYYLFGIAGLIAAPVLALLIRSALRSGGKPD